MKDVGQVTLLPTMRKTLSSLPRAEKQKIKSKWNFAIDRPVFQGTVKGTGFSTGVAMCLMLVCHRLVGEGKSHSLEMRRGGDNNQHWFQPCQPLTDCKSSGKHFTPKKKKQRKKTQVAK